ncbi:hypothetical protein OESDEN_03919 [Oesophagostomum dentatum]|uniref:DM13 domain-containing protein n=1 Tax=Oesophagostomum dentatum TaxID=61180 RepID=A0A0B1TFV8_OESDE|nr:hypothetical protein OESDEN_03919 [Oesophagostomum dentatum]
MAQSWCIVIHGKPCSCRRFISSVNLTKEAPVEKCCIRDPTRDVVTGHYGTRLRSIAILDAQTILLQKFTIQGSKPPDAWIYAGRGEINQENGKKGFILGRDTPAHHCSIREDWTNEDIVVRLGEYQTVYDIEWVSVFCYNYSVDFAHLPVKLDPNVDFVPAYLPEFRDRSPYAERKIPCD